MIKHLKERFAHGRDSSYYNSKIANARKKQGETAGGFYDRLKILLDGVRHGLKEKHPDENIYEMLTSLEEMALDSFFGRLPLSIMLGSHNH